MMSIPSRVGAAALVTCGNSRLSPASIPSGRPDDPRMGRLFTDSFDEANVVLIGFPHDEGCRRNGGRPGAALGPSLFRKFVTALGPISNPERNIDLHKLRIFDWGDIVVRETAVSGEGIPRFRAHVARRRRGGDAPHVR